MRQWTYTKLPCSRCQKERRIKGGRYCATCSLICPRCEVGAKTPGHGWCSACRSERRREQGWKGPVDVDAARRLVRKGINSGEIVRTPCHQCGSADVFPLIIDPGERPPRPAFFCKRHLRMAKREAASGSRQ